MIREDKVSDKESEANFSYLFLKSPWMYSPMVSGVFDSLYSQAVVESTLLAKAGVPKTAQLSALQSRPCVSWRTMLPVLASASALRLSGMNLTLAGAVRFLG